MKKLMATLLALVLALSCAIGLAEEYVPEAVETMAVLNVDRDFVKMYASMFDGEGSTTYADLADLALNVIDKLLLDTVYADNQVAVTLYAEDTALCSLAGVQDETGIALVSDLFPHYALRVNFDELQKLLEENVQLKLGNTHVSKEEMEAALAAVMGSAQGYVEDLITYANTLMEKVEVSEDGNAMYLTLTTHEMADIVEIVTARLATDEALLPYVQAALTEEDATVEDVLNSCNEQVAAWRAAEPETVAEIAIYLEEDGSVSVEVDFAGNLLVSASTYVNENDGNTVEAYVILCNAGTDDWTAIYNGVISGENTEDTVVYLSVDIGAEEDGSESTFVYIELMQSGSDFVYSALINVSGVGTADYKCYINAGLDIGLTDDDVIGFEAITQYVEAPEAISLDGLTVINVLTMSEEEQNALLTELMSYGLPALLANAQQAMPDEVAVIMQLLMGAEEEAPAIAE